MTNSTEVVKAKQKYSGGSRTCDVCKCKMYEGYLHEELLQYFCSDKCLDTVYPGQSEFQKNMTDEDLEEAVLYWTDWEGEVVEDEEGEFENLQHTNVEDIICPNCGFENNDVKSVLKFEDEIECEGCYKRFGYTMTITYSTHLLNNEGEE